MTAFLHRPATRRLAAALGLAAGVVLSAGPAGAHIHTDPEQAPAGSTTTVGFEVEHGCEGSPTVEVSIEIPQGVNDAQRGAAPGVVRLGRERGGPLDGRFAPRRQPGRVPAAHDPARPARTAAVQDDPALRRGVARLDRGHRRRPARTRAPRADPRGHRRRPRGQHHQPARALHHPATPHRERPRRPLRRRRPARPCPSGTPRTPRTTTAARCRTCSADSPRSR